MRKLKEHPWVTWEMANNLSQISILKGFMLYIPMAAILSKVMSVLEETFPVIQGSTWIPFSSKALFISAIIYIFGWLIYRTTCPKFISDYPKFSVLKDSGFSSEDLVESLRKAVNSHAKPEDLPFNLDDVAEKFLRSSYRDTSVESEGRGIDSIQELQKYISDDVDVGNIDEYRNHYKILINYHNKREIIKLCFCLFLFLVSYLILAFLFLQNIQFVIEYVFIK